MATAELVALQRQAPGFSSLAPQKCRSENPRAVPELGTENPGPEFLIEYMPTNACTGFPGIKLIDISNPTPDDDGIGIEDVDNRRDRLAEFFLKTSDDCSSRSLTLPRPRDNFRKPDGFPPGFPVGTFKRWAGKNRLDATFPSAVARVGLSRERVVPPLAGNSVSAIENFFPNHNASTDTSAENQSHNNPFPSRSSKNCLGKCKAIGVVRSTHLPAKRRSKILPQRLAVQAGGIRIFHRTRAGFDGTGGPDSQNRWTRMPGNTFKIPHYSDDLRKHVCVSLSGTGFPSQTMQSGLRTTRIQDSPLDFCASEVDSPELPAHTETRMGMIT